MFRSLIPPKPANVARLDEHFFALQRNINRIFDDAFRGWPAPLERESLPVMPSVDVKETEKAVEVTAELPGVDQKDVHVTYASGVLTIKGEKKAEKEESKEGYQLSERSYGSFMRSMSIDDVDADRIEASFANGVLKITLAKSPSAKAKTKTIEIKTSK